MVWTYKKATDALAWLAQQSGYWFNVDSNGVLWFQPYTGVPAPWSIDGTQVSRDILLCLIWQRAVRESPVCKGSDRRDGTTDREFQREQSDTLVYPVL